MNAIVSPCPEGTSDMSVQSLSVSYIRTSVLPLCYTDEEIQALIDRTNAGESRVDVLLSINRFDAILVLCGLASQSVIIKASNACARRAKEYADRAAYAAYAAVTAWPLRRADSAAYADRAADRASDAADAAASAAYAAASADADCAAAAAADAAYAAAYAAADAAYAAAADAELEFTIRHFCMLMGWK